MDELKLHQVCNMDGMALVKMAHVPNYRNFTAGQSKFRKWEYCFLMD